MGAFLAKIKHNRKYVLMVIDMLTVCVCYLISLSLFYSIEYLFVFSQYIQKSLIVCVLIYFAVFYVFRMYESIWRYADVEDFFMCLISSLLSGMIYAVFSEFMGIGHPTNFYIASTLFISVSIVSLRMAYRLYRGAKLIHSGSTDVKRENLMIVGGGQAGILIKKEIESQKDSKYILKCIVDDDAEKIGRKIDGTKIEGPTARIEKIAKRYDIDTIIVAIPSASDKEIQAILNICAKTGCSLKILPSIYSMIDRGEALDNLMDKIKPVEIEDLLGREPVELQDDDIAQYIKGKKVLVTGGGGSIGSELCRQIAKYEIEELTIVDIYENNAYEIQLELESIYKDSLKLDVIIASIRDEEKIRSIFDEKKPDIVFHAAAHKHVPLMERVPAEAIKNNVFGTYNVAKIAAESGVKKFVLISTDKAVNPTNIMGATKRMAEMIVQTLGEGSKTEFVAVRFGNVLGSSGSVIPLFKKQIEKGGPLTVTDERVTRFFMTIPEAVQLVLKAGSIATGGEIFILDMGEPVKIKDLAENLIRLSGLKPYEDIDIVYTGLRPGEKLYEELLIAEEGIGETKYPKIFIGKPLDIKPRDIFDKLDILKAAIREDDNEKIKSIMEQVVDTYSRVN